MIDLRKSRKLDNAGEKACNLHWLIHNGYRVPETFVLPYADYDAYLQDAESTLEKIRLQLVTALDPEGSFAVRSSASLEDSSKHSFAGQFRTFLNMRGTDQICLAVQGIWDTMRSASVQSYAQKFDLSLENLKLAVIIQEMVTPVVSGVAFSKNPLTGLNEIVIEAILGSGDQLVQDGISPERWVYRWGDWVVQPESRTISQDLLLEVAHQTAAIARQFNLPVDLEWVYDGHNLFWVQLRPITQLEGINIYSNRISREVFPGLIKPLIWSLNVPLVNTVWINLFSEMIGPINLKPEDLAKQFGYRAYFNMGAIGRIFELMGFPKESLEILLGLPGGRNKPRFKPSARTLSLIPRLISFAFGKLRLNSDVLTALADARRAYASILEESPSELDEAGLIQLIDRLYAITQKVAYYNVVVPLLMNIYNGLLRRQLSSLGVDYAGFDLTDGLVELQEYDPNVHIRLAASAFNSLDDQAQAQISMSSYSEFTYLEGIHDFQDQISGIIARFGHLSDSGNDFSTTPWREMPDIVLSMVLAEAQHLADHSRGESISNKTNFDGLHRETPTPIKYNWQSIRLNPIQRLLLQPIYARARNFRLYREAVSSIYTYGYGLFRNYFLELGRRFVSRGMLIETDDIFYLRWDEIRKIVLAELDRPTICQIIEVRKAELHISQELKLPEIIYDEDLPSLYQLSQPGSDVYKGIPSSRGYYRGTVKVIRGLADFGKLAQGDVLVIPYSDVSWTPLFSRAGAVIAESGGILSHSSIVAREFNLPCVVSVSNACQIPDNALVSVDGFKGEVVVHSAL